MADDQPAPAAAPLPISQQWREFVAEHYREHPHCSCSIARLSMRILPILQAHEAAKGKL